MSDPTPLDLATTEELFNEIVRRTDAALLVIAAETKGAPDAVGARLYYSSSWVAALGLARWSVSNLIDPSRFVYIKDTP